MLIFVLGLSDVPGEAMVKLYCPKCMDVYTPKSSRHHHTDGAYFGTGFPHMLFMVHPEYRPKRPAKDTYKNLFSDIRQSFNPEVYLDTYKNFFSDIRQSFDPEEATSIEINHLILISGI